MNRPRHPIQLAGLAIAILAATFTLISCEDFFGAEDIKQIIKEDVDTATADPVTFIISPSPTSGGALSFSGTQTKKIGESFILTATAFDAYVFTGWAATGTGTVVFGSPSNTTTTVKITNYGDNIEIIANFAIRPYVKSVTPSEGNTVVKNSPIVINFNKPMLEDSFTEPNNIIVTYDSINPTISNPVTIYNSGTSSDFFSYSLTSTRMTLTPKNDSPTSNYFMPSNSTITVYVDSRIEDSLGNSMPSSKEWYFYTNDLTDLSAPTISGITVRNGDATSPIAKTFTFDTKTHHALKTTTTTLEISASTGSASSTVQSLTIIETGFSSGISTSLTTETGFASSYVYNLRTTDEGPKQLTYFVKSSNLTESAHSSIYLYLDSTPPVLTIGSISSNNITNANFAKAGNSVSIGFNADDALGSGIDTAASTIAGLTATVNGSMTVASTTITDTTNEGSVSYSISITDYAGNSISSTSGATGSVTVDRTAPSVGLSTILTGWFNNSNIPIEGTASDTNSGVLSVQYSTDSTNGTDGMWTTLTGTASWTGSVTFPDSTANHLYIRATDNAGNINAIDTDIVTAGIQPYTVKVDTIPPTLSITSPSVDAYISASSKMIIDTDGTTLTAKLAGYDPINYISGTTNISSLNSTGWSNISQGGDVIVTVYSSDAAGNISENNRRFMKDTVAPGDVTGQTATPIASGKIRLDWTKPVDTDYKQVNISWTSTDGGAGASSTAVAAADPQSFEVTGLTNGKTYEFTFQTQDNAGNTSTSATKPTAKSDATAPGDVTGQTATPIASGKIRLDWTKPVDTDYKQVNISWTSTDGGAGASSTAVAAADPQSFEVTGLTNGKTYEFTFQTQDNAGNTSTSATKPTAKSDATAPGDVTGQTATPIASGKIRLDWTKPVDTDYKQVNISWTSTDGGAGASSTAVAAADPQSFEVTGLTNGKTYEFTFQTQDNAGNTSTSATKPTAKSDATAPGDVTGQTATPIASGKIRLDWTKPVDTDYKQVNISWTSTDGGAGASSTAVAAADPQSFEVTGLTNGKTYEFTFQTQDNAGNTSTSATKPTAKSDATAPGDVTGQTATPIASGKIRLDWTKPVDTDYKQVNISWTSTDGGAGASSTAVAAADPQSFEVTGLTNGKTYEFTFQTQDNAGNTSTSATKPTAKSDATAPGDVTGQTATPIASGKIRLDWTKPVDTDYKQVNISWTSTDGGAGASSTAVAAADPQSFEVTGLTNGKTYEFTFQTQDNAGNTSTSATKPTAKSDATAPGDVTGQTATPIASGKIRLDWTKPVDTDYKQVNISWTSTDGGAGASSTAVAAADPQSFEVTGLTGGKTYEFTFQTQDNAGNTSTSATKPTAKSDATAPGDVTGQSAAAGSTPGTITVTWTAEPDGDFKQVNISWISGSIVESIGSAIVAKGIKEYTSPVLTSGRSYTFTLKTEDTAGNIQTIGVDTDAVLANASALTLTLTDLSVALGPVLTYTGTSELVNIYYWADSSFEPSAGVTTSSFSSGMELTELGEDKTFSFYFDNGIGVDSITYTLIWDSVNLRYGTEAEPGIPISRSLSPTTPISRPRPTYTNNALTNRRPTSYLTPVAFTPPATTPAQWLSPNATEPATSSARAPASSAGSVAFTPRLSVSAQAKANAILAAYSMPSTGTSMTKLPAKAQAPRLIPQNPRRTIQQPAPQPQNLQETQQAT
jgi:hypothetical protein